MSVKRGEHPVEPPVDNVGDLVEVFNRVYYNIFASPPKAFHKRSWRGVPVLKCPEDLWALQEIVSETMPDVIVETGVANGGSVLYLADLCRSIARGGRVVACDVTLDSVCEEARRAATLLPGSSTSASVFERVRDICRGRRTMVILDSDHRRAHVAEELRLYAPLVSRGCYLVVEDTNLNRNVVGGYGPGPGEALDEFLATRGDEWSVERRDMLVTFCPGGYLRRL